MNFISESDHKTVLVTGFLPFKSGEDGISINPSIEAVKLLDPNILKDKLNITVVKEEVPVEYEYVDGNVSRMFDQHQPDLTIHVGVSSRVDEFTLEKNAKKNPYTILDNCNCVPSGHIHPREGPDFLATALQVENICETFNEGLDNMSLKAVSSDEAGCFVCEYMYYSSLCEQRDRGKPTLFVHVPMMEAPQEFRVLANGLERLLEICVQQIRSNH